MTILYQQDIVSREHVSIDIEDRGYQFGDGVYEVVRIYDGKPFRAPEHLDRLSRSVKAIGMDVTYDESRLQDQVMELAEHSGLGTGIVYLQITRGVAKRSHEFPSGVEPVLVGYARELPRKSMDENTGVAATVIEDIRWLRCDIKSLNLLGNVMAKQKAIEAGSGEAVQHRDGTVTEGSASNVFIVEADKLWTPPANNLILNGITRLEVLDICRSLGIEVMESPFSLEQLHAADEVFVTSTTMEINPLLRIDDTVIGNGNAGTITRDLQREFERRVHSL